MSVLSKINNHCSLNFQIFDIQFKQYTTGGNVMDQSKKMKQNWAGHEILKSAFQ